MKIPIFEKINKKIGIDLGSSRTRIWVGGAGIVLDEPTCIAFDTKTKSVLAVGTEAVEMDGRVGSHVTVLYPVVAGEIYDSIATKTLLKIFLNKSVGSITLYNPIIMASVPAGATQATREIITEVLYSLGAGEVYTIAQPLAACIGSGVPIADASGSFLLNLGAGVTEGVVISLGSIIVCESSEYAGDYFTDTIRLFAQKNLDLKISKKTASFVKKEVVSIDKDSQEEKLIAGQDLVDESLKELLIKSKDLFDHTVTYLEKVEETVVALLSKVPPELAVDAIDKGLLLTGGGANIAGIESFFIEKLGIPVSVVDESDLVVIKGIGQALTHLDLFKQSLLYHD